MRSTTMSSSTLPSLLPVFLPLPWHRPKSPSKRTPRKRQPWKRAPRKKMTMKRTTMKRTTVAALTTMAALKMMVAALTKMVARMHSPHPLQLLSLHRWSCGWGDSASTTFSARACCSPSAPRRVWLMACSRMVRSSRRSKFAQTKCCSVLRSARSAAQKTGRGARLLRLVQCLLLLYLCFQLRTWVLRTSLLLPVRSTGWQLPLLRTTLLPLASRALSLQPTSANASFHA
mmetsp:Transcript_30805/g.69544  ORF Transcript_30805/g.69544 Transcript_30805/m.69544 type:complete len:230 (+) Transcript_30805:291-980(+)